MCDTLLALPDTSAEQGMLFAKNSDRQRNEVQVIDYFAAADHSSGSTLTCTYLTIPQAPHTYAVLLSRPFWMWGAEMGANEHGVVIGNEGLQARSPAPQEPALTGMDLLRLALERAASASQALQVITGLLERHGQGGNCGHITPNYYNNGFLIADAHEAFVLETVGREWMVERARGVRALSNTYSISRTPDRISPGLSSLAAEPDYASAIASPNREHIGHANARRARSTSLMQARIGRIGALDMMQILRDHRIEKGSAAEWHPQTASTISVCMHAAGEERPGQTVNSWVSEVHESSAVHWVTATAAPCTSVFKPLIIGLPLPPHGPSPRDCYDPRTLWWRHESFHRAALRGEFGRIVQQIAPERDALETEFRRRVSEVLNGGSSADRVRVVGECWNDALAFEDAWPALVNADPRWPDTNYGAAWFEMDRRAGVPQFTGTVGLAR
jgi:dipeptidase